MKQKITIMKQQLDLSDEEINRYMDFDSLRRKQMEFESKRRKKFAILKWSVPALLLLTLSIWFVSEQGNDSELSGPEYHTAAESNQSIQSSKQPAIGQDSATVELAEKATVSNTIVLKKQKVKPIADEAPVHKESVKLTDNSQGESVYVQAEPVHGYASLYGYLNSNLQYPVESIQDSIQGIQTVSFVINEMGKPEKIQFGESLGAPFENEAKRLIENMPAWKPATLNGKPVSSKLALPITFQIKKVKVKE